MNGQGVELVLVVLVSCLRTPAPLRRFLAVVRSVVVHCPLYLCPPFNLSLPPSFPSSSSSIITSHPKSIKPLNHPLPPTHLPSITQDACPGSQPAPGPADGHPPGRCPAARKLSWIPSSPRRCTSHPPRALSPIHSYTRHLLVINPTASPSLTSSQKPAEQMTAEPVSMRGGGEGEEVCCGM